MTSIHMDTPSPVASLTSDLFIEKVRNRTARIAIVGLGYVGLPLAYRFCREGFFVAGIEASRTKIEHLSSGRSFIKTFPDQHVAWMCSQGFRISEAQSASLSDIDAVIICVPTPLGVHHEPDLRYVREAARCVAKQLRAGQLVVLESTTYPGTTEEELVPILESCNTDQLHIAREPGEDGFYVGYSPEREDPGNTSPDSRQVPKIVSGIGEDATRMVSALYQTAFDQIVPVSSTMTAEMAKLLENVYRCVNIALVNELKQLCQKMGVDIYEVIQAAKTKPFGFHAFYPGPGLGGHCIPVDPFYLTWKAKEFQFSTRFIELAGEVNRGMPDYVVAKTAEALNRLRTPLFEARLLILGVAYKRDIDDTRESPALAIVKSFLRLGARVSFHDPHCTDLTEINHDAGTASAVPLDLLEDFDCVVICTDHTVFDYPDIVAKARLVVDSRNATAGISSNKIVHC